MLFVNELAVFSGAEELAEVEGNVLVGKLVHEPPEVVCVDIHARKTRVGVMVAGMCEIPLCFGALLHNVIPGVSIFICEFILNIKWSTAEMKKFRLRTF